MESNRPPELINGMLGDVLIATLILLIALTILLLSIQFYFHTRLRQRRYEAALRYSTPALDRPGSAVPFRGLVPEMLLSLPVTVFSAASGDAIECAVCLSDLAEGEMARFLPSCGHGFHADCIDMWFSTHATCPVCRAAVIPALATAPEAAPEQVAGHPNRVELRIEVPERRVDGFGDVDDELRSGLGSATAENSGIRKSPATQRLSLRRLLSRNRMTSGCVGVGVAEQDLEHGEMPAATVSALPQSAAAQVTTEAETAST